MRKSQQREAVYSVIKSTTSHPDAYWVYEKAREIIPDISLGTVYRNLGQLAESGDLITIFFSRSFHMRKVRKNYRFVYRAAQR